MKSVLQSETPLSTKLGKAKEASGRRGTMGISVCVCTRNRADSLKRALESLTRLDHPSGIDWGVLVVDNGSTDATADTAMSFADLLTLKVVSETRAGLSHARNTALRVARGHHLIFIDDDVTVPPTWLAAYATGFGKYPDAGFFGGPSLRGPRASPKNGSRLSGK